MLELLLELQGPLLVLLVLQDPLLVLQGPQVLLQVL